MSLPPPSFFGKKKIPKNKETERTQIAWDCSQACHVIEFCTLTSAHTSQKWRGGGVPLLLTFFQPRYEYGEKGYGSPFFILPDDFNPPLPLPHFQAAKYGFGEEIYESKIIFQGRSLADLLVHVPAYVGMRGERPIFIYQ